MEHPVVNGKARTVPAPLVASGHQVSEKDGTVAEDTWPLTIQLVPSQMA
jgi:hypothetical protein